MFLLVIILVFVNVSSANRYEAAEAIQLAIFGDSADEPSFDSQTDEVAVAGGDGESSDGAEGAADIPGEQEEAVTEASHDSSRSESSAAHTSAATDAATSYATRVRTDLNSVPMAGEPPRSRYHGAAVAYIMYTSQSAIGLMHATSSNTRSAASGHHRHTTSPPKSGGSSYTGQSYSFQQLSLMTAGSAPGQQGNFYRPETYEHIPEIQPCQAIKCHLSIAIVMDSSGSVGENDYRKELSFVKTLLEILSVKAADSKLHVCTGIVSYSTDVFVEVDPCCENSICRIVDQFRAGRMQYRAGATNTNGALKVARQMLQAAASHKKVALLITDGKSNTGVSPVPFAKRMRDEDGIQIVALGVTSDVNRKELMGVSGMNKVTKIDVFDDFHELASILLHANKVSSQYELDTTFDAMCYQDKTYFKKNQCVRTMTEEQKKQCVWGDWSSCVRQGGRCSKVRTCMLNGIVILREDEPCTCPPCDPGYYLNPTNQYCLPCLANTYSNDDRTLCLSCPVDKVSSPGSSSIDNCVKEFDIVDSSGSFMIGEERGLLLYKGGTVCDDYFDINAAVAICKLMGRPHDDVQYESGRFFKIQDNLPITMDDVNCPNTTWGDCVFRESHNCRHHEDVHIACRGTSGTKMTTAPKPEASQTTVVYHRSVSA